MDRLWLISAIKVIVELIFLISFHLLSIKYFLSGRINGSDSLVSLKYCCNNFNRMNIQSQINFHFPHYHSVFPMETSKI